MCSATLFTGCNLVGLQAGRIKEDLERWGMHSNTARLGDDTVHYWDGGSGPPVVLLHGFGAAGMWQWHEQAEALLAHHRVIVPDLLWFGASYSDRRDFSLAHQAEAVFALLDTLRIPAADVVGLSYGGYVAHELATLHDERVRKLVLIDSPVFALTENELAAQRDYLGGRHPIDILVPTRPEDVQRLLDIAFYDPPWVPGFAREDVLAELYGKNREEKRELYFAARPVLRKRTPHPPAGGALVIWGREDDYFPLSIGRKVAAALQAPLHVIPKARHAPNLERPAELNRALLSFLGAPLAATARMARLGVASD